MQDNSTMAWILVALEIALQVLFVVRALLRTHREPSARMAWVLAIVTVPVVGIVAYVLFGETNIGRRRIARMRAALKRLPSFHDFGHAETRPSVPERYQPLFRVGHSISDYPAAEGNEGTLLADSDAAIDAMVADIDAASDHVHVLFYIWLVDNNGMKMIAALKRAAERGVTCRVMVDDIGSRTLTRSAHWRDMASAGVKLAIALPVGNPLLRPLKGRIDMRNHRKIVVIDNRVTYCGSQNCADAAFAVKARFAPWVDIMVRFQGPVVRQNQHLFASDWMGHVNEDLSDLLRRPQEQSHSGFTAQVIGTGATTRYSAMPEMFVALMNAATRELVLSTPYYVPDEPIQAALCASAHRGVATTVIFPKRNDSWFVAAASRSYYRGLLEAGVRIFEYPDGLLHAKTLTLDGEIGLIGSANVDRRSFELNFENNILFYDTALTAAIRARQHSYIAATRSVSLAAVAEWSRPRRLLNNAMAMIGPLL